jgi:hypothetical protein
MTCGFLFLVVLGSLVGIVFGGTMSAWIESFVGNGVILGLDAKLESSVRSTYRIIGR